MKVRTRFAPSPTGYMHVGNLRTALYAYLLAKKDQGTFILRIEDTDRERYVEGAVDIIYNTLKETGLQWDEGPDIGGPVGPYVQSERMGMFLDYAKQLVEKDGAYYCFCDKERLDELHAKQQEAGEFTHYDGCCRSLTAEEVQQKLDAGIPYVIRQKMPKTGETFFDDEVFGRITVENETLEDQILIKTDGMPTYNFANVVDDHLMGITHVVRGAEYLSSAPKYNLLYQAFGWDVPVYVHCSPVMKNASEKLSKRNGDASYQDLVAKGYLPEAVMNYIALLGWAPKGEEEIFSLEELCQEFSIAGISKSPAIFDSVKLTAINGKYIRNLSVEEFLTRAMPYIQQGCARTDLEWTELAKMLQPRAEVLTDIPPQLDFIDAVLPYDAKELFFNKKQKMNPENCLQVLQVMLPALEAEADWSTTRLGALSLEIAEQAEVNKRVVYGAFRLAVSGKVVTPGGGDQIAVVIGKEETLSRVKQAIEKLQG